MKKVLFLISLSFLTFSLDAMPPKKGGRYTKQAQQKKKQQQRQRGGAGGGGSTASVVSSASGGAAAAAAACSALTEMTPFKQSLIDAATAKTAEVILAEMKELTPQKIPSFTENYNPVRLAYETAVYLRHHPSPDRMTSDKLLKKMILAFAIVGEMTVTKGRELQRIGYPGVLEVSSHILKTYISPLHTLSAKSFQLKNQPGELNSGQIKSIQRLMGNGKATVDHQALLGFTFKEAAGCNAALKTLKKNLFLYYRYDEAAAEVQSQKTPAFDYALIKVLARSPQPLYNDLVLWGCPLGYIKTAQDIVQANANNNFNALLSLCKKTCWSFKAIDRHNFAMFYLQQQNYDEAKKWLNLSAEEGCGQSLTVYEGLSRGQEIQVQTIYQETEGHEISTLPADELERTVEFYMRRSEYHQVLPYCRVLLQKKPSEKAVNFLIICLMGLAKEDEALQVARQYKRYKPPLGMVLLADEAFMAGDAAEVIACFKGWDFKSRDAEFYQASERYFNQLAYAYVYTDQSEKAFEIIHLLKEKTKRYSISTEITLSGIYKIQEKIPERIMVLKGLLDHVEEAGLAPEVNEEVLCYVAESVFDIWQILGNETLVEATFSALKSFTPVEQRERFYTILGKFHYMREEYDETMMVLMPCQNIHALVLKGTIHAARAEHDCAIAEFKAALKAGFHYVALDLAFAFEKIKKHEVAEKYYKMAVRYNMPDAIGYYADFLVRQADRNAEAKCYRGYAQAERDEAPSEGGAAAAASRSAVQEIDPKPVMRKKMLRRIMRAKKTEATAFDRKRNSETYRERNYKDLSIKCASQKVLQDILGHELRIQGLLSALANGVRAGHFETLTGYEKRCSMRITCGDRLVFDILEGGINAPGGIKKVLIISASGHYDERDMKATAGDAELPVSWSDDTDDSGSNSGDD